MISFTTPLLPYPSKNFDLQLGYGKTFIGDGVSFLLTTDGASPHPYFKLNTTF
jgi:hypothetical protein